MGSGPDVPAGREAAKERLSEVLLRLGAEIPPQVTLTLEPTDREIDKRFLFGPVEETAAFVHQLQAAGLANLGVLLDMGHVPLMGETLESAVTPCGRHTAAYPFGQLHLKKSPAIRYMANKHVAWGAAESEYGEEDAVRFIHLLQAAGYFQGEDCTVSFEMRPIEGYRTRRKPCAVHCRLGEVRGRQSWPRNNKNGRDFGYETDFCP